MSLRTGIVAVVVLALIATGTYVVQRHYLTPSAFADSVMEDMRTGTFPPACYPNPVTNRPACPSDDRTDNQMALRIIRGTGERADLETVDQYNSAIFAAPRRVLSYELLRKEKGEAPYWAMVDLADEGRAAHADTYRRIYREEEGYHYDESLRQIAYIVDRVEEWEYVYRVDTGAGYRELALVILRAPSQGWRVVAIRPR